MATNIPPEAQALLETIAGPESAGSYNVIYGGSKFDDYADHPRDYITIRSGPNKGDKSSAAGKYQFLASTWDNYQQKLGLPDFSPESQDKAAWQLAQDEYYGDTGRDLLTDLRAGDISRVPGSLRNQWTSMPGGIEQGIGRGEFETAFQSNLKGTPRPPADIPSPALDFPTPFGGDLVGNPIPATNALLQFDADYDPATGSMLAYADRVPARLPDIAPPAERGLSTLLSAGVPGGNLALNTVRGPASLPMMDAQFDPASGFMHTLADRTAARLPEIAPPSNLTSLLGNGAGQGASFGQLQSLLGLPTSVTPPSGVTRTASIAGTTAMPAGVRPNVPSTVQPSPRNDTGASSAWSDFSSAFSPPEERISIANPMVSQAPNGGAGGGGMDFLDAPAPSWSGFTDAFAPPAQAAGGSSNFDDLIGLSTQNAGINQLPTGAQIEAATGFRGPATKTVMRDVQVENPAYSDWLGNDVGAGVNEADFEDMFGVGLASKAPAPPPQFLTVQKPVEVPVTPAPPKSQPIGLLGAIGGMFGPNVKPPVPGTMFPVGNKMAPAPYAPFAPFATGAHPAVGLLGSMIGPNSKSGLASLLGLTGGRAPVGSYLGTAGNGGAVTQGYSGLINSITQASDAWKHAVGEGGSQQNDPDTDPRSIMG